MDTYFKTPEGRKRILSLYDQKLEALSISYDYVSIDTSFGKTNVIATGDASNPPLIIVHGSNGCAPIALETYPNLSKTYRVYAVDVLAQPNKSAQVRLSMKDQSYGKWMNEVIDLLQLEQVTMAGFSFGGLVILKTLEYDESKVKEAFLAAPAYVVNGNPLKALFKVFIPMKRYIKTKRPEFVEKFLAEVFTQRDPFAISFLSQVFVDYDMDFTPVPTIQSSQAQKITTPITLFAAKDDVMFPGRKMLKRAHKIFPSLKQTVLFEEGKHVQDRNQNNEIEAHIMK